MLYIITAIRSKDITWSGGIFKKYEVKTDKTGAEILELRLGKEKNAKIQMGQTVEGYVESDSYKGKSGIVHFKVLKGINAEYVYKLLLKLAPDIEAMPDAKQLGVELPPEQTSWGDVEAPVATDDIGF